MGLSFTTARRQANPFLAGQLRPLHSRKFIHYQSLRSSIPSITNFLGEPRTPGPPTLAAVLIFQSKWSDGYCERLGTNFHSGGFCQYEATGTKLL
ncbi:hypothetical protein AVEN_245694-1 [Araneus ventricosus]|uniref:Uncharacterized protein n=1 Tax=Araneus ventricosus TaxID=182803 RepID=A0A4Y2FPB1_ARAVE|nr:hypothetical protein AVEN_245694-1 [Araneus ventricosus]